MNRWSDDFEEETGSQPSNWEVAEDTAPKKVTISEDSSHEGSKSMYVVGNYEGVDSAVGNLHDMPSGKHSNLDLWMKPVRDTIQLRIGTGDRISSQEGIYTGKINRDNIKSKNNRVEFEPSSWINLRFKFLWDENQLGWELYLVTPNEDHGQIDRVEPSSDRDIGEITGLIIRQASFGSGEAYFDDLVFNTGSDRSAPSDESTSTPEKSGSSDFVDRFEDGDREGWSILWLPENTGGPKNILNDWEVTQQSALQGEYSLKLHSISDHNAIVTDDYILDLSDDFEFSFEFYFENGNSRGAKTAVCDVDRNGSKNGERVAMSNLSSFVSAYRKPADEEAGLTILGNSEVVDYSEVSPGDQHRARISRQGSTIIGYLDGSEIHSIPVSESKTDLDKSYRLVLQSSGSYGSESRIWWDSIRFVNSKDQARTPTETPTQTAARTKTTTSAQTPARTSTTTPTASEIKLNPEFFRPITFDGETYEVYWGLEGEPDERLAVVDQEENLVSTDIARNVLISNAHLEHISLEPWDQYIENAQNRRDFYMAWEGTSRFSDLGIEALATFALSSLGPLAALPTAVDALKTSIGWTVDEIDSPYKETLTKMNGICRASLQHEQVVDELTGVETLPQKTVDTIDLAISGVDQVSNLYDVGRIGAKMARVANSSDNIVAALKTGGVGAGAALGSLVVGELVSRGVSATTKPFEAHAKTAGIGVALNTLLPSLYEKLSSVQEKIVEGRASPAEISLYWRHRISTHQLISVGHEAMGIYEGWLSDQPLGPLWNVLQNAEKLEETGKQSAKEHYNLSMYYLYREGKIWSLARSQTKSSVNAEILGGGI